MQDYIFYNDRLLLKKETAGKFHVPYENELPDEWQGTAASHEVLLPNGTTIRARAIGHEVPEDDAWLMVGLRASFDYLPLAEYKAAGKAFQILWWDIHSRFCPVCGTRTEQRTSIMKKCVSVSSPRVLSEGFWSMKSSWSGASLLVANTPCLVARVGSAQSP